MRSTVRGNAGRGKPFPELKITCINNQKDGRMILPFDAFISYDVHYDRISYFHISAKRQGNCGDVSGML